MKKIINATLEIDTENLHIKSCGFEAEMSWVEDSGIKLLSYTEISDDDPDKNPIGFCPHCYAPIYEYAVGEDENDYGHTTYVCPDCGATLSSIILADYAVGESVRWEDPCREPNESDEDYNARTSEVHTITAILGIDGNTSDDIIYELDNGTEVNGSELNPA